MVEFRKITGTPTQTLFLPLWIARGGGIVLGSCRPGCWSRSRCASCFLLPPRLQLVLQSLHKTAGSPTSGWSPIDLAVDIDFLTVARPVTNYEQFAAPGSASP